MTTLPTLSEGSAGPDVRWAQYLLVRRTMSYDQIDGEFGPVTKNAVQQFQRDSGLADDGIIGPLTWGALGGDRERPPLLKEGSQGEVVSKLQTALNEGRGEFAPDTNPVLAVDGSSARSPQQPSEEPKSSTMPSSTASCGCRRGPSRYTPPAR